MYLVRMSVCFLLSPPGGVVEQQPLLVTPSLEVPPGVEGRKHNLRMLISFIHLREWSLITGRGWVLARTREGGGGK